MPRLSLRYVTLRYVTLRYATLRRGWGRITVRPSRVRVATLVWKAKIYGNHARNSAETVSPRSRARRAARWGAAHAQRRSPRQRDTDSFKLTGDGVGAGRFGSGDPEATWTGLEVYSSCQKKHPQPRARAPYFCHVS